MTDTSKLALRPGEIRLDYIPLDWPLTPLGPNKNPYLSGWQNQPLSPKEIEECLLEGDCKAIGLIGGPAYNEPYGLVWVDVDGLSVRDVVEKESGFLYQDALPPTLTICSGKEGRERKLYQLNKEKHKHFVRNKYVWYSESESKEKLEVLWKKTQGVLMGLHPETEGYYTAEGCGFEWASKLPELPDWILNSIINKNVKQGVPTTEKTRVVGPNFAVNAVVSLERDIQLAVEATWALPLEAVDDYDMWITAGQVLHSLDESLLDVWDEWSKQSSKYVDGECHKRWMSFTKGGGRGVGTLLHHAKQHGYKPSQDHRAMPVDDNTLEHVSTLLEDIETNVMQEMQEMEAIAATATIPRPMLNGNKNKKKKKRVTATNENNEYVDETGDDGAEGTRNPPASDITDCLLQLYKRNLLYGLSHGMFFKYEENKGLWSPVTKVEMLGDIRRKLKDLGSYLPKGFSINLMNDILQQLQAVLAFDKWHDDTEHLLFTNGVLDVNTKELLPFKREMYFTQQMPYPYVKEARCEPIIQWLKQTQHNSWERCQVLRAWLRACLLGRYEIQKFVEIVGPGKSGKSTYANLAVALVGKSNTYSTDFENLEKNRFEAAAYMGKKLLLFQDADRWGGSVSKLKAITGNDWIRSERKYQGETLDPFQYHGMVMITANEAIQSTDYTSGLARRRLTIPFDKPFEGGQAEQKELMKFNAKGEPQGEFAPLLPGLVNWLLEMDEDAMRRYLMETGKQVDFFRKYEKSQSLRSNPLLDWMEHKVVFEPGAHTAVGYCKAMPSGGSGFYANWNTWLYASYAEFCRCCNTNIMSRGRFEPLFLDICKHQLKIHVFARNSNKGMRVFNVAIRDSNQKYDGYPSIVEVSSDKEKYKDFYGMTLDVDKDERMEVDDVQ